MWTPFMPARCAFVSNRLTTHSGPLQAHYTPRVAGAADNCELEEGKAWQADPEECAWCDQLCCCNDAAQAVLNRWTGSFV